MVALDTNIGIEILRGKLQLPQERQQAPYALPTVVAGELLFGAHNSGRLTKNLGLYRTFIRNLPALLLDAMAAEHYAEIRLVLKQKGRSFLTTTCGLPPSAAPTTCRCSPSTGTSPKSPACGCSRLSSPPAPARPCR